MQPSEIKVLAYINKKISVSTTDIENRFKRYDHAVLLAALWNLEVQYDYIRELDNSYVITDKGKVSAFNEILTKSERNKERLIGFVSGIISGVLISVFAAMIIA